MAQYERIMRNKEILALMNVQASVSDLKKAIHNSTDKLEARAKSLENVLNNSANSQSNLQKITIALTIVIALSTIAYTWITWQTVLVQKEANQIQQSADTLPLTSGSRATRNKTRASYP